MHLVSQKLGRGAAILARLSRLDVLDMSSTLPGADPPPRRFGGTPARSGKVPALGDRGLAISPDGPLRYSGTFRSSSGCPHDETTGDDQVRCAPVPLEESLDRR